MVRVNKKGQVTLFIVLAILLVFAISLAFFYVKPEIFFQSAKQPKFESCLSNSLDPNLRSLALNAGILNPKFNYQYMGNNYTYLCYTNEDYQPCVNQEPFLTRAFENSLRSLIKREFQECYDSSVEDLRSRGYDVQTGAIDFNVSIEPGEIAIDINAPLVVSRGESTARSQTYRVKHRTNLYELLMVATSLVQFETYYGDSEQTAQMLYYPNILIDKQRRDDDTKVYTLTERNEKIEYRFAVRSYSWPAGGY
jgi:hypothetical protein